MPDGQIPIDTQGGDPSQQDMQFLREGGQTGYGKTYEYDHAPFDDGAKVGQEHPGSYAPFAQRYPINQSIGTRLITGHWLVPFTNSNDCEMIQPLLPDPLTGYGRKSIMIYNNSSVVVYVGMDANVSPIRDFPIPAGGTFVISKDASCGIWLVSTPSVVADVRYCLEMGFIGALEGRTS